MFSSAVADHKNGYHWNVQDFHELKNQNVGDSAVYGELVAFILSL